MIDNPEKYPQTLSEFGGFIKRNQNRLVNHAFFRLGNHEEAEDIVQDVMIRIYQQKEFRNHIERPVSYAFKMVYNSCIDHLRKKSKMQFEINSDGADSGIETKNRESEIIAREEFQRIQYLLNSIPEEQAEVIRLRTIDDMSFVEIAELLKLPVTTIKSRFLYGISKLRSKVNPLEERTYELH